MKHHKDRSHLLMVVICLLVLFGAAFCLACLIATPDDSMNHDVGSLLDRVLGSTRVQFGNEFYLKADQYFHKGVDHTEETGFTDPFQRLYEAMTPQGHVHAEGIDVNEIMPWLRFATDMDSHNVDAYLVAAYWIARGGHPELAEDIYREAKRNNPGDYRVFLDWARCEMRQGHLQKAAGLLDRGLRFMPVNQKLEDKQMRIDLGSMLELRGMLYAYEGETQPALRAFEAVKRIVPERTGVTSWIDELKEGTNRFQGNAAFFERIMQFTEIDDHDDEHHHDHEDEGHGTISDQML